MNYSRRLPLATLPAAFAASVLGLGAAPIIAAARLEMRSASAGLACPFLRPACTASSRSHGLTGGSSTPCTRPMSSPSAAAPAEGAELGNAHCDTTPMRHRGNVNTTANPRFETRLAFRTPALAPALAHERPAASPCGAPTDPPWWPSSTFLAAVIWLKRNFAAALCSGGALLVRVVHVREPAERRLDLLLGRAGTHAEVAVRVAHLDMGSTGDSPRVRLWLPRSRVFASSRCFDA